MKNEIYKKNALLLVLMIATLLLTRCSSVSHLTLKNEVEKQLLDKANSILETVAVNLSEPNRVKLEEIKIYLKRTSFSTSYRVLGKKIFIPA